MLVKGIRYNIQTKETEEYEEEMEFANPRISEIERRLQDIRAELQQTDYKAIKFGEGCYTTEQYEPTRVARQDLRDEYNNLEVELATLTQ